MVMGVHIIVIPGLMILTKVPFVATESPPLYPDEPPKNDTNSSHVPENQPKK